MMIVFTSGRIRLRQHLGSPPPAGTRSSPVDGSLVANTIESSRVHLAPRTRRSASDVIGGPPLVDTFFSVPRWRGPPVAFIEPFEKADPAASGEKNGARALTIPVSGTASS